MVKLLRVDDRLIHGQVAFAWTSFVGADAILIPSDSVAMNSFRMMALKIAAPPNVALEIKSVADGAAYLADPGSQGKNVFVVCENISDAHRLCGLWDGIRRVCVGGARQRTSETKQVDKQVNLTPGDMEKLRELEGRGVEVFAQDVPTTNPVPFRRMEEIFARK